MTEFLTPTLLSTTAQWIVVAKPSGWLTIPPSQAEPAADEARQAPVLATWLRENYGPIWVVHRLDRETSGVVLFARTAEDHALANTWFQNRRTKKIYHCFATGVPSLPVLKLNEPVRGVPSLTQVEVLESYVEGFFGKVLLKTGRRHQIRIHLAQVGHSLWGDPQYGGPTEIQWSVGPADSGLRLIKIPRVALHASHLELPSGEKFTAPLPPDFITWLDQLRKDGTHVTF